MEEEQKNRYVIGTIGALIGAFVGAIPWILMYVYGNTIYAVGANQTIQVSTVDGNGNEKLNYEILGKGFSWIDTGTFDSLYEACEFIKILEKRQGIKISVPEEIAYRNKWISEEELYRQAFKYKNNSYGKYLNKIIDEGKAFGGKYV